MAMTFTLVSHLREQLASLVSSRVERRKHEESEKERQIIEVRPLESRPIDALTQRSAGRRSKNEGNSRNTRCIPCLESKV